MTDRDHSDDHAGTRRFAGFWIRLIAFALDVIPITLALALVFFSFFGFDETVQAYLQRERGDIDARRKFLTERNEIRDLSFAVYLVYAACLEATALGATLGKRALGLVVVDRHGEPICLVKSIARNIAKITSLLPLGLGFLWAAWSPGKRGWHDYLAGTYVVRTRATKRD